MNTVQEVNATEVEMSEDQLIEYKKQLLMKGMLKGGKNKKKKQET